jgi:hypothetical protein
MITIRGLNELQTQLGLAQKALASLDGELGAVSFDPNDPGSIEAAVVNMEAMIDERLGDISHNAFVGSLVAEVKEKFREAIIQKAAAARLAGEGEKGTE